MIPLGTALGTGRDAIGLVYGLALAALTLGVLLGARYWRLASPAAVVAATFLLAACGIALATVPSLAALYLGYGVLFGFANGSGYGFALVIVNHALPARRGVGTGAVTAAYALGAMMASWLFREGIDAVGLNATLLATGAVFLVSGTAAALLLHRSGLVVPWPRPEAPGLRPPATPPGFAWLWLGYGCGCMAGLMVLGHAAAVMEDRGAGALFITVAMMAITGANACGSFAAGWLADRGQMRRLVTALPLLTVAGLALLAAVPGPIATVIGLAVIQVAYGAIIAAYPVATTALVGPAQSARVYGLVFTSWGVAGFAGPWLAGALFETTGDYTFAFVAAAAVAVLSSLASLPLRRRLTA